MSKFTKLKVGQVYNGFKVISIDELAPFNSDGILFIHEKTGMQVFHLLNADEENLFSFGFRTPCENSMGVAHIMEHSVLCGSKNYPLKDPFKTLANQSVKTFLNAMTFPDKTVYPASSVVEQDYFNLMAVYADAVFFPLLTEQTFLQEGHRYEVNSKGELELQGVVFNEMKGAYSSIESVIEEEIKRGLLPKSSYQYDSGGDPLEIPDLTYEEFIEFHKKHYIPSNCFLFLYGNIESEKQLDFINEKVLREFSGECASHGADDHSNGADDCARADDNTRTALQEQFDRMTFCENFTQPKEKVVFAPLQTSAGGKSENKDSVILSWNLGEVTNSDLYMKAFLLSEILMGHDGSPFSKAL